MGLSPTPIHRRSNSGELYRYGLMEQSSSYLMMMEKRQLFLRSYQFNRKGSLTERIKRSLTRVKRVFWFRLRSAHKIRKLVWSRLRYIILYRRKRRFLRVLI
ncbi:hypothetical protein HS088_TW12G01151 [Tripterygium wilfordii]|uniref:Uncharacterized protein n=1 Tax=Tripterygium wilfordii TaxID=458696 RepID=A0A7J7D0R2_TRIWF|nr:hypothetical protein HS088_TW12G01151 [Tripterygium wilfordii]